METTRFVTEAVLDRSNLTVDLAVSESDALELGLVQFLRGYVLLSVTLSSANRDPLARSPNSFS